MAKLENAPQTTESAEPASSNLTAVARPPRLAKNTTAKETTRAPTKAMAPTERAPHAAPTPNNAARVAPSEAPDEMPRMYGSASGFLTMACITTPQRPRAAPTAAPSTSRGSRISQTTSCSAEPAAQRSGTAVPNTACSILEDNTPYTSPTGSGMVPKVTATTRESGSRTSKAAQTPYPILWLCSQPPAPFTGPGPGTCRLPACECRPSSGDRPRRYPPA